MKSDGLNRRDFVRLMAGSAAAAAMPWAFTDDAFGADETGRPNIILCMTDDQGWGDTGYNGHPVLKTPALDEMAAAGIRFNRFYAAAPVCSPTRGSVLTGRHPNRFGCFTHGKPIRKEEVTIAQAVKQAGYTTGHFGKWHLNGKRGPGKPISADDPLNPGQVGFDEWFSVSNFFDLNPTMSRKGEIVKCTGDSSDITMDEALKFIGSSAKQKKPFLAVIWYGSPHNPHRALAKDKEPYKGGDQNYYGEITAVDRTMGRLRKELRDLKIADNTIVWFCSDNGGAKGSRSTGGLRGQKGSLWEGGVRVPGILEWPARIKKPFQTDVTCSTMDIYPTVLDLLGIQVKKQPQPIDGVSLVPLINGAMTERPKPLPFWVYGGKTGHAALIDGRYKLHLNPAQGRRGRGPRQAMPAVLLYDLVADGKETTDLAEKEPERVKKMKATLEAWKQSVRESLARKDYLK